MFKCKWLGLAVAALFCIGGSAQAGLLPYYNAVMADNPIVYYQFDEALGTTTAHNYGSAASADGTYYNVVLGEDSASAGLGTCGEYNGTTGTAGSITKIPANVTAMNVGTGDYSVELWYCTNKTTRSDIFVNKDNTPYNQTKSLALISNMTTETDCVYERGNTTHNTKASAEDEVWHHLVFTRTSGSYDIYVDTVKTDVVAASILDFDATWSGIKSIGSNWDDQDPTKTTQTLLGYVDEFAFYSTALSQERIDAHYAAAQVPEPSTLALLGCGLLGLLAYAWRKRK